MVSLMTALWFASSRRPTACRSSRTRRRCCTRSTTCSAGSTVVPDDAAPVRRAAVLPEPHQGPGPGRLLDGLGRARRDGADLGRARAPLRRRALRRAGRRPPDRADRRRRARRGRLLGGDRRPDGGRLGEVMWVVDLNRQSLDRVVPDIAAGRLAAMFEAAGWQVREVKYGGCALFERDGGERCARASTRCPTRSTSGCCAPTPPSCASGSRSARCRPATTPSCCAAFRDLGGHDLAALIDGYRGRRRARPPERRVRLHDQGLAAADRGPPGEPLRAADRRAVRRAGGRARHRPGRPVGGRSSRQRRRPSCARATARRLRARAAGAWSRRPRCRTTLGREHRGSESTQQAFGRFLVDLVREAPEVAAAGRHRLARRRHLDQPRRLDQQGRHLVARRPDRLVRRRHRHARALARDRPRPAHRARDRRGQPRRPARRARRDVVARRPAAAPGRHDLRPVRRPRARAVVVRDLRGRPVDPRRHAEGRHARPGGRRAPVGDHAVDRDRAAGLRRLGAGVRAGPRVDVPARAVAARAPGRRVGVLPALDAPDRPGAGRRRAARAVLAGGYRLRPQGARV